MLYTETLTCAAFPYLSRRSRRHAPTAAFFGAFLRAFSAIERSDQRRIEQEAARFVAKHGGRLTDDLERQLTEHFKSRGFLPA